MTVITLASNHLKLAPLDNRNYFINLKAKVNLWTTN